MSTVGRSERWKQNVNPKVDMTLIAAFQRHNWNEHNDSLIRTKINSNLFFIVNGLTQQLIKQISQQTRKLIQLSSPPAPLFCFVSCKLNPLSIRRSFTWDPNIVRVEISNFPFTLASVSHKGNCLIQRAVLIQLAGRTFSHYINFLSIRSSQQRDGSFTFFTIVSRRSAFFCMKRK